MYYMWYVSCVVSFQLAKLAKLCTKLQLKHGCLHFFSIVNYFYFPCAMISSFFPPKYFMIHSTVVPESIFLSPMYRCIQS